MLHCCSQCLELLWELVRCLLVLMQAGMCRRAAGLSELLAFAHGTACCRWCGSAEGLDAGRHCMHKWGFKRIEDSCWIKSNTDPNRKYLSASNQDSKSILTRTKVSVQESC